MRSPMTMLGLSRQTLPWCSLGATASTAVVGTAARRPPDALAARCRGVRAGRHGSQARRRGTPAVSAYSLLCNRKPAPEPPTATARRNRAAGTAGVRAAASLGIAACARRINIEGRGVPARAASRTCERIHTARTGGRRCAARGRITARTTVAGRTEDQRAASAASRARRGIHAARTGGCRCAARFASPPEPASATGVSPPAPPVAEAETLTLPPTELPVAVAVADPPAPPPPSRPTSLDPPFPPIALADDVTLPAALDVALLPAFAAPPAPP